MIAIKRFKKDFGYYLLGIIVPALLNAALILVIKHLLGAEIFGSYSLKFNFLLLLMATLIGGITQSIIRFRIDAEKNLSAFYCQVFLLARNFLLLIAVACFLIFLFIFHENVLLSFLFSLCVIGGSLYNILMAISQANFQSKFILLSEGVRALVFFALSFIALSTIKTNPQALLFFCLLFSYIISTFLLATKNKLSLLQILGIYKTKNSAFSTKIFLTYGFPLSLWYAFYYLCTYLDKPLLAHDFGFTIQGNYQAMFDVIFRGITGIMSPFPLAVLPILTQTFQQNKSQAGINLLQKLIGLQIIILLFGTAFYWFFAFNIMANFLLVPITINYKLSGLLMIIACMVWQIGILNHKLYKLVKRTDLLLKFMLCSLFIHLIAFIIIRTYKVSFFSYVWPFLISGICYNLLCLMFGKQIKSSIIFIKNNN